MPAHRSTYRAVLSTPDIIRSFAPSIVGRLSLATSGLALVLLLEQTSGSFTVAGLVVGALGLANVVATPLRARLIDRRGQPSVLSALGATHAAALLSLALAHDRPGPLLVLLAVVAGASSPPFGAAMRVLWSTSLPTGDQRTQGFSLDAVAEELTFVVGPLAAAGLAALLDPSTAMMLAAGFTAIGTAVFVTSPLSRRHRGTVSARLVPAGDRAVGPLRIPGFAPLVAAVVTPGIILGSLEIAAPALATEQDSTVLSGALLALFASASATGGLLYGRVRLGWPREGQLLAMIIALLVVAGVTGIGGTAVAALVGFALCGFFLAPILIVGDLCADARTDPRTRTEANSWINTAVNLGAAVGSVSFGALTDLTDVGSALTITAVGAGAFTLLCAPALLRDVPPGRASP